MPANIKLYKIHTKCMVDILVDKNKTYL